MGPAMIFDALSLALDASPEPVEFWWRDDDAGRPSDRLTRLLSISRKLELPLAVAVVPAWLENSVARDIRRSPTCAVLQHGWDHEDHSRQGEKKIELGGRIDHDLIREKLTSGLEILRRNFHRSMLPVLVPPWNRIDPALVSDLPLIGYESISTFGSDTAGRTSGLNHINPQIDPIAWRSDRAFASVEEIASSTSRAIAAFPGRPIGLLTHHLDMDEAAFQTLETILSGLRRHEKAQWPTLAQLHVPAS